VEYARTVPEKAVSVTRPYAIGVAFTPQPMAVWDVGGHTPRRAGIQPAAVFLTASDALYWQRWEHISESVEMWLDRPRLNELGLCEPQPLSAELSIGLGAESARVPWRSARVAGRFCRMPRSGTSHHTGVRL